MHPLVSIILPVYNAERYITLAIESILHQTFTNFELITIDDGSTDQSETIIKSIADPRILYYKNDVNAGLAYTLNKGIALSKGVFIARMDADDIALPNRIEKQLHYLQNNPSVDMIDCIMQYIDDEGKNLHKTNATELSYIEIKKTLPKSNCLGHSSILIRGAVLRKYKYKNVGNEDYELWLRMIADGIIIHKLNDILLKYRIHQNSYTFTAHTKGIQFLRQASSKKTFLLDEWIQKRRFSAFSLKVFFYMLLDYIIASYKLLKLKLSASSKSTLLAK